MKQELRARPRPTQEREPKGLEFDKRGLVSSKSGVYVFGFGLTAVPVFVHRRQSRDAINWKVERAHAQRDRREMAGAAS